MTLIDYWTALRRRWVSICAFAFAGLLIAGGATFLMPKVYDAQSTSFVAISADASDPSATSIYQGGQFAISQVQSYTELATSAMVLKPVIESLDLPMTVRELQDKVTATSPRDSVLLYISVADTDPALAAKICNATAKELGTTIKDLASPSGSGASLVQVTLTQPATTPSVPTSPRPKFNLALGLLLGLIAGAALAVVREQLDTTVTSTTELQDITDMRPLGVVEHAKEAAKNPLVAVDPSSEHAEAFRTLRTNLQFVDVDAPPRSIVITSAMASEGKTTVACNLAITLAQSGLRVCLVEADLRRPKVCDFLGIEGSIGLTNVLAGQHDYDDVLVPWKGDLLTVIGPGTLPPDPSDLLASNAMSALVHKLVGRFDFVILDAPPLLVVPDAAVVARIADGALLVARYEQTTRDQVRDACEALEAASGRLLGTVLTCVPAKLQVSNYRYVTTPPKHSKRGVLTARSDGSRPADRRPAASAGEEV